MLQIYNTLLRRKETFKPINPGHASIYVCGMTVYDFCHIGHARVLVVFDMVTRWLRASGFEVNYVRNITDIDDKIIKRAIENNETIGSLTNRFIKAMHEDADALGVLPPNFEPRATQYIDAMQGMIGRLIEKNIAYQADSGDVNFSVREFPGYGKLSGKSLDDLEGDRVIIVGDKKDPLDFVMWKSAKTDEPEDTRWNSPWGEGRPGWHIECSAMSCELLGYHFDIHGGGADLQFPHHENEIAQSEGVHRNFNDEGESSDPQYVNYWMHNGHVRVNNEKMAKSLGNFFIIRDVLKKFDPEVIRFFILRAHYRSPVNYSDATLEEAKQGLERLYNSLSGVAFVQNLEQTLSNEVALQSSTWYVRFKEAMDDDFNTSEAIAVLFELSTEINRSKATHQVDEQLVLQLRYLWSQLGLLQRPVQEFLQGEILGISVKEIEDFIQERILAKKNKDFVMADKIRKDLLVLGVILEDQPGGITVWRKE